MSDIKIFTNNIDGKALDQIYTLAKQPAFADCKIRIMPDVHAGAGCVIGFISGIYAWDLYNISQSGYIGRKSDGLQADG